MLLTDAYEKFSNYYLLNSNRSVKTRKEYNIRMTGRNGFITFTGDMPIELVNDLVVLRWKLYLRGEGLSAKYINHNLNSLKIMLRWLSQNGHEVMDFNKIMYDKLELNKPHTVLSEEEVSKLIDTIPSLRDKAFVELLFATGCRVAEIIDIDKPQWEAIECVDADNNIWELWVMGKGSKYRPVCFDGKAKMRIELYLKSRTDCFRPLFVTDQSRRVSYAAINRMLHKYSALAGIEKNVTAHVMRHSYATIMAANGAPIPAISYSLGHSNTAITERVYIHINKAQSSHSYAKFHPKTT